MTGYLQSLTFDYATFIILNLILSTIVILLERKNPTGALAWLFFLNLFPGFGFFFYILLAQNISKRKIFIYTQEEAKLYQNFLKEQRRSIKSGEFVFNEENTEKHKDMILFHNKLSGSIFSQNNEISIFTDGNKKFEALFKDINEATHHIHLLYYIVKHDDLGDRFLDLIEAKAKEGIEVRLLVDHIGSRSIQKKRIKQLKKSGVYFAFFFPSMFKYFNLKGNYRNHRKIAIIDGSIGYIGGYNIGDEYIGLSKKFGYWRDTHLRIIGDSVFSLQLRFILDWRNASNMNLPMTSSYLRNHTTDSVGSVQIVDSGPDNINEQIKQGYLQIIHQAKDYLYIQSPYFIPDESIIEGLKIAAAKGVDVRIMIPNKPDHVFVYWATYSYCGELLPYGVRIYTYENGFLHSKTIVSDDSISSVGTCNFDIRSFKLNFEINAFIYNVHESTMLRNIFESDINHCRELSLRRYNNRSLIIKGKEAISRLFSPVL